MNTVTLNANRASQLLVELDSAGPEFRCRKLISRWATQGGDAEKKAAEDALAELHFGRLRELNRFAPGLLS